MNPNTSTLDPNGMAAQPYKSFAQQQIDNSTALNAAQQAQQQPTASATTGGQQDSGNWFTHLLPTIGSVAIPTIAALLAPETGGLSLLGGAALSGLGGAGGQVAENTLEGKNPLDANVLESGVTNAIAGGAGGILGKIGSKFAAKTVAPAAGKVADSLIAGQAGKGQVSTDLANVLRTQYGATNLNKVGDAAKYITGQDIGIDKGVNGILDAAGSKGLSLNMSSFARAGEKLPSQAVNDAAIQNGLGKGTKATNAVQDYMDNLLQKYNQESVQSIPGKGGKMVQSFDNGVLAKQSPLAVKQMTSDLGKQASQWLKSSDPTIQAQGRALQQIRNDLTDNLYGAKSGGAIQVTPEDKQAIIAEMEPLKGVDKNIHAAIVDKINNAQNLGDLRSIQAPIIQAKSGLEQTAKVAAQNGGSSMTDLLPVGGGVTGFGLGGVPGGIAGYAAGKALESPAVGALGADLASKVSAAAGSKTAQKVIPLLSRIGTVTAANLPTMGAGPASGAGQTLIGSTPMGTDPTNPVAGGQASGGTDYDKLVQAMIAQSILAPTMAGGSGASSFLSALAPALQKRQTLETELSGLQGAYNQAGGAQGLGGIGSVLSSFVPGTAANAYKQQQEAAAALLGNTLGTTKQEAGGLLPGLLQSGAGANQKFVNLNNILASLAG